ncbi:unnamed protein product [Brassica oleracea]
MTKTPHESTSVAHHTNDPREFGDHRLVPTPRTGATSKKPHQIYTTGENRNATWQAGEKGTPTATKQLTYENKSGDGKAGIAGAFTERESGRVHRRPA